MNILIPKPSTRSRAIFPAVVAAVAASLLASACAPAPIQPAGASDVRAKLTRLQDDPALAQRASAAITEAQAAVVAAEQPEKDKTLAQHRVYMADHKVEIAMAQARTSLAESQRSDLSQQRDNVRLEARTREADAATGALASAREDVARQVVLADAARRQNEQNMAEMQQQLDELQAKSTERGMVLTLGDVLFTSGQAALRPGATANLDRLATFLTRYPDQVAAIEGHTDSQGGEDYNIGLSQRRAETVRAYLTGQGVAATRLSASGMGESSPVADNESAAGRQQNRRVEVILSTVSVARADMPAR